MKTSGGGGGGGGAHGRSASFGGFGAGRHRRALSGAFYTLVPIRPRWRGERRSLRTFPGVSLRPPLAFNPRLRRLSTPPDAFPLHPDFALYGPQAAARSPPTLAATSSRSRRSRRAPTALSGGTPHHPRRRSTRARR
jgi:hypothetical protein